MKPNPDQLAFIHTSPNPRSNAARYDEPATIKAETPVVIIGPNAVYLNEPGYWPEKVGSIEPPPTEPPSVEEAQPPVLLSVSPAELPVWAADTEVFWNGSGFTESSKIIWNNGEEPTKFIDTTKLSTIVKPSTVQVPPPFALETYVVDGDNETAKMTFTFIA